MESPESVLPQEVLLLQGSQVTNTSAVLCIDSRIGVSGCVLGDKARAGRLMMTESEARPSLLSELNRRRNEISGAEVMLSADLQTDCLRKYDVATYIPKKSDPDDMIRQKIFEAAGNVRDDGVLYFSAEAETAEKYRDFLERFGDIEEKVNQGCKLLEVFEPEKPREKGFLQYKRVEHSIKGEKAKFRTLENFFTGKKLNSIEMLSRELEAEEGEKVLDLSCGFGGVGIFSAKLYDVKPVFVDRNAYMKELVEENCDRNGVEDFKVACDDGAENLESAVFDRVTYRIDESNDDSVIEQDIRECRRVLKSGGELLVCHSRDYGAEKIMRKFFGDVQARRREVDHQVSVSKK